ncbi:AraC family transcriptional regulator [Kineobactrum sediminis]|uniref:AraC family transcriptional regulator n=1 Tax=Kineobactrum sediminis TaxID=1905677 RepID=A0A2N5Y1Z4_9GAMM|nr:AraC family transcriptional regulator [Kineobactrum sediminis]PLW82414.1 AraC family transcriptional regulator [Kineobactrum sediminis]
MSRMGAENAAAEALHRVVQRELEPSLSPRFVAYVRDYLLDHGITPEPVFRQCGIVSSRCEELDVGVPARQIASLLELAAQESGNPCMGLHMAQRYHYESASLLILAMLAAPSVADGIRCLCHYDRYVDTAIEINFDFSKSLAEFSYRVIIPEGVQVNQLNEYLQGFLVQALNTATRIPVPIKQVCFSHDDDQNAIALEAFFKAPVKFSCTENRLFFDRSYLQERFHTSHSLLHEILVNAMKTYFVSAQSGNGFVDILCREIIRCGADESATLEKIAERLAISPRTLRRRLSSEGRSFQEVKNLARAKRAKYYLRRTTMPLAEIAYELGFSELSAFSRAFRSWVGQAPQAYRAQGASPAGE